MPTIRAAVLRTLNAPLVIEDAHLEMPRANEVLVRISATGVCHTDAKIAEGDRPVPTPVVLGHEGAGYVEAVGTDVRSVRPGDAVVLSFPSCGHCENCSAGHPAICMSVRELTFGCSRPEDGSSPLRQASGPLHGYYFGQSSFGTAAIAPERNVVPISTDVPLELLGPLGCGLQTGAGTVLNALKVKPGSSIAIFGSGSVGLAAVMAAKLARAETIIAVDMNPARLALARELGATHTMDTRDGEVAEGVRACTDGAGVHYAIDTTNHPDLMRTAFGSLRIGGTYAHVGGGGTELVVPTTELLFGRTAMGVVQGDSVPQAFIPQLIEHYRAGHFPFDRLLAFYDFDDINQAFADMHAGQVVKPVLRM